MMQTSDVLKLGDYFLSVTKEISEPKLKYLFRFVYHLSLGTSTLFSQMKYTTSSRTNQ